MKSRGRLVPATSSSSMTRWSSPRIAISLRPRMAYSVGVLKIMVTPFAWFFAIASTAKQMPQQPDQALAVPPQRAGAFAAQRRPQRDLARRRRLHRAKHWIRARGRILDGRKMVEQIAFQLAWIGAVEILALRAPLQWAVRANLSTSRMSNQGIVRIVGCHGMLLSLHSDLFVLGIRRKRLR